MTDKEAIDKFTRLKRKYEDKGVSFDLWNYQFFSDSKEKRRYHYVNARFQLDENTYISCTADANNEYLYAFTIEYVGGVDHKASMLEIPSICQKIKQLWQQDKQEG